MGWSTSEFTICMSEPEIFLEPVTATNWKACIALELAPGQEHFVPSNLYSIAEAQFYPDAQSNAIYNEYNELVGYALYGIDVGTSQWKIFRIMIDKSQQHKGYGESAIKEIIARIFKKAERNVIWISYHQDNHAAQKLYAKLGFIEQHCTEDGHVSALLGPR